MVSLKNKLSTFNAEFVDESWKAELKLDTPHQPIFEKGLEVLSVKGDLLLAICLNNGYYNKENIYRRNYCWQPVYPGNAGP